MGNMQKCGVVGVGFVGACCAYTLAVSGLFSEIVLVDVNRQKAESEAADINHGVSFAKPCHVGAGDYSDLSGCGLVILAAGANQRPGETRVALLGRNRTILSAVVGQVVQAARDAVLLVVSNPVDVLTCMAQRLSGLPAGQVIGSGTVLDTARLKYLLGQRLGVDGRNVHAFIIGEHGDSELAVWSSANISGVDLDDYCRITGIDDPAAVLRGIYESVRGAAYPIIEGKGATYYGIAMAVRRIAEAIGGHCTRRALGAARVVADHRPLRGGRRVSGRAVHRRARGRAGCARHPARAGGARAAAAVGAQDARADRRGRSLSPCKRSPRRTLCCRRDLLLRFTPAGRRTPGR